MPDWLAPVVTAAAVAVVATVAAWLMERHPIDDDPLAGLRELRRNRHW